MSKIFSRVDSDSIRKTIRYYRDEIQTDKKRFVMGCIFIPMQHFLYIVLIPLLVSFFTQSLIENPKDIITPLIYVGIMIIVGIGAVISGHIGFINFFAHEERVTTRLLDRAMKGLLAHSHTFFVDHKVGSLAGDVNTFSRSYISVMDTIFLQASATFVSFVASLIIVAFIAPLMLPILLLLTLTIIQQAIHSYTKRSNYRKKRKEMQSRLIGSVADVLGNQTLVRMFGRSKNEVQGLVKQRHEIEQIADKEILVLQQGAEIRLIILIGFQIATLVLCLYLFGNSLLSIAALIFIITYLGRVTGSLFTINAVIRGLEQAFLDASKVTEILDKTPEVLDNKNAQKLRVSHAAIAMKGISFSYEEAKKTIVFENLNIVVESGQSIGLVGKSGGGKSTLTHLLLRYMDINKGEILIDNQNIADVTQNSLRDAIAYVPQDPFLFHRSLRDNIAYGKPNATDYEVIAAAKAAYAYEFIQELPNGLSTIVGERGVKLSGGQRQRIAIARAILKDAPILVLDEATSALDSESEVYIQKALTELMKNRTSIVIAHRLSTIARLDRIIVLDKGQIVEDGTHTELLAKNGTYARLWKHQSGGFIEE